MKTHTPSLLPVTSGVDLLSDIQPGLWPGVSAQRLSSNRSFLNIFLFSLLSFMSACVPASDARVDAQADAQADAHVAAQTEGQDAFASVHASLPSTSDGVARKSVSSDGSACTDPQELDRYQQLRRLSMDLRGRPPTVAEYNALDSLSSVPDTWLDEWMTGDEFRLMMRRYHEALLWPNPSAAGLVDTNVRLVNARVSTGSSTLTVLTSLGTQRRTVWRGGPYVCGAYEQTQWKSDGSPVTRTATDPSTGQSYQQDGYVRMAPYWDPSTPVNVCAFEAMENTQGKAEACNTLTALRDPLCGCGPDLKWCFGGTVDKTILIDLREQFNRAVDEVTVGGYPYTDLLTSKRVALNGHLQFWKKNLAQMVPLNRTYNAQGPGDPTMPENPSYTDASWTTFQRSDVHAGILTMAAYTLRFQTNRGRANRFRVAFTGQYFVPTSQPEDPTVTGCNPDTGDLTQLCTCRTCHGVLEPLAAYFGQVSEAGSTLISNFPDYYATCNPANYGPGTSNPNGSPPASCTRFFSVSPEDPNPGWRLTHQWAYVETSGHNNEGLDDALHRSLYDHLLEGPGGLAEELIATGQLAQGTVKNLFHHLMRRDMILDPSNDLNEISLLSELSADFEQDYDLRRLIKRLVSLPQYRRVNG